MYTMICGHMVPATALSSPSTQLHMCMAAPVSVDHCPCASTGQTVLDHLHEPKLGDFAFENFGWKFFFGGIQRAEFAKLVGFAGVCAKGFKGPLECD